MSDIFFPGEMTAGFTTDHEAIIDLGRAFDATKPVSIVRYFLVARTGRVTDHFRIIVQYRGGPIDCADAEIAPDLLSSGRAATLRNVVERWLQDLASHADKPR